MALVALVALGRSAPAGAASSCPTSAACVIVTVENESGSVLSTRTLSPSDVSAASDQVSAKYGLRREPGGEIVDTVDAPGPTSVPAMIEDLLGIPVGQVDSVTVARASSGSVGLSADAGDLAAPGNPRFEDGNSPSFFVRSGQPAFVRPLHAGDSSDVNYADSFQRTSGAIRVTVRTHGAFLEPKLTATKTQVAKNEPTTLTVSYPDGGAPPTGSASYTWDFYDATPGPTDPTSTRTTHQWAQNGRYLVSVTVKQTDQDGRLVAGGIAQVRIKVGKPTSTGTGGNGTGGGLSNGTAGGTGTYAGGGPTSPGGTGDTGTSTDPGTAGQGLVSGETESGITVQGVLLDATGAPQESLAVTPSAPLASAPTGAPRPLSHDLRWMLALAPLLLLLLGGARQTRWVTPRLPQPPWR